MDHPLLTLLYELLVELSCGCCNDRSDERSMPLQRETM